MTKPKFYIAYNNSDGFDPVTCEIGTARELRIGDDIGERHNNEFWIFEEFLACQDRDVGDEDFWIENRPCFVKKFEEAKKYHAARVAERRERRRLQDIADENAFFRRPN